MSPQRLHLVLTLLAGLFGSGAFLALGDGHLRSGLQLVVLVVGCFALMAANHRRTEGASGTGGAERG